MGASSLGSRDAAGLRNGSLALCLIGKVFGFVFVFVFGFLRDYYAVFQAKNASSNSDMRKAVIAHGSLRKLDREGKLCVLR